jgi:hypothetical protein
MCIGIMGRGQTFHVQKNQSRSASMDASANAWMPAFVPALQVDESCQSSQLPPYECPLLCVPLRKRPQSFQLLLHSPAIVTPNAVRLNTKKQHKDPDVSSSKEEKKKKNSTTLCS